MKAFGQFWRNGWLLILLALAFVAAGYSFYLQWHDPQKLQNVGAIANFGIAGLLALVTWQYAIVTQRTLDLYKEQWAFQQKIGIRVRITMHNDKPWVRVVNPGGLRFTVPKAVFKKEDGKPPHTAHVDLLVGAGEKRGFAVPRRLYENEPHNADINMTLYFEHYGRPEATISRAFRIEMSRGKVYGIKQGVHSAWLVTCPKCENQMAALMRTEGLENFEQAKAREDELKEHLLATCPNHQSPWSMDTVEDVKEVNERKKAKGTEE